MTLQQGQKSIGQEQQPQRITPTSDISDISRPPPAMITKGRVLAPPYSARACTASAVGAMRCYTYLHRFIQAVAAGLLLRCTTAPYGVAAESAQVPPTEAAGATAAGPPPVISRFHSMLTTGLRYVSPPDHKFRGPFRHDKRPAAWGWTWWLMVYCSAF